MARAKRLLPSGCSFHITLRCNSSHALIAKGQRRDLLLALTMETPAEACRADWIDTISY